MDSRGFKVVRNGFRPSTISERLIPSTFAFLLGIMTDTLWMVAKSVRRTLKPTETCACWYLQWNHHSKVSWVVQDFVHPQYGKVRTQYATQKATSKAFAHQICEQAALHDHRPWPTNFKRFPHANIRTRFCGLAHKTPATFTCVKKTQEHLKTSNKGHWSSPNQMLRRKNSWCPLKRSPLLKIPKREMEGTL